LPPPRLSWPLHLIDKSEQWSWRVFTLREQRQRTALHIACEKGSVEVVDKLLEMRSDVRHADKVSLSP